AALLYNLRGGGWAAWHAAVPIPLLLTFGSYRAQSRATPAAVSRRPTRRHLRHQVTHAICTRINRAQVKNLLLTIYIIQDYNMQALSFENIENSGCQHGKNE